MGILHEISNLKDPHGKLLVLKFDTFSHILHKAKRAFQTKHISAFSVYQRKLCNEK